MNPFEFRPYYTPFTVSTTELAGLAKRCDAHVRRRTNIVWKDPPVSASQVAASSVVCSTCMGSKVLRHFAAADESGHGCPPETVMGPSEWAIVERVPLADERQYGVHSTQREFVELRKGQWRPRLADCDADARD